MNNYIEKTLYNIIESGQTSITFTNDFITDSSVIDVYFDDDDVVITECTQSINSITVSIESRNIDTYVAVHIINDDTIDYSSDIETLNDTIDNINTTLEDHDERITNCFTSVSNGKSVIASAITDKGVQTLATDTFQTMATNISNILSDGVWRKILSNGQISTLSEYKYPQFTDSIPNTNDYLLYVVLTEQSTFTAPFNVIVYRTTTGNIECNIGARSLKITFNRNGVYAVTYTGSWANLYIDCYIQKVEV